MQIKIDIKKPHPETLEQYKKRISHPILTLYLRLLFVVLPASMLLTAFLGITFPDK